MPKDGGWGGRRNRELAGPTHIAYTAQAGFADIAGTAAKQQLGSKLPCR